MEYYFIRQTAMGWLLLMLSACGSYINQPLTTQPARLGPVTQTYETLKALPPPAEAIPVAVYKFRDQTGQYKPSELGNNWSTAVTQGATTILNRVLEESGWFKPIERENISNLLNERKIIRSSRMQYNDDTPLPPLLFAGIILEGGIISYESNVLTGGAGLRYFGTGASGQYREDRLTVYLRAVSTRNGQILKTVYTTKTLLSQMVDVGLFRYVEFKRLLEVETGFTYNEPTEMAVTAAIEKAVYSLVIEGVLDGYWSLKDPQDLSDSTIVQYLVEKKENRDIDYLGRKLEKRRDKLTLGVGTGLQVYEGDLPGAQAKPAIGGNIGWMLSDRISLHMGANHFNLQTDNGFAGNYTTLGLQLQTRLLPYDRFTPMVGVGSGLLLEHSNELEDVEAPRSFAYLQGVVGGEYMATDRLGLLVFGRYSYALTDELDGILAGQYNDVFWGAQIGLNYYFNFRGKKGTSERAGQVPDLPDLNKP